MTKRSAPVAEIVEHHSMAATGKLIGIVFTIDNVLKSQISMGRSLITAMKKRCVGETMMALRGADSVPTTCCLISWHRPFLTSVT